METYALLLGSVLLAILNSALLHRYGNRGLDNAGDILLFNGATSLIWILVILIAGGSFSVPSAITVAAGVGYGAVTAGFLLSKMLALALDGITSMSTKPIRLITGFGCVVALLSFIGVVWSVVAHFMGVTVAGWSSMVSILCFLGGIQLLGIGVIGEYVGKTYMETKHRPRYIISEKTWEEKSEGPASPPDIG